MEGSATFREHVRRLQARVKLPSLPSRTVTVLIPLHVLTFVALYYGIARLVKAEVLLTHSRDGRILLSEAIRDLHPYMCTPDRGLIPEQVRVFAARHAGLQLHVYRRDGTPMSRPGDADPEVGAFLVGNDEERFLFAEHDDKVSLHGMIRLSAAGSCVQCHNAGEQLGAAAMCLDLTNEIAMVQAHLRRNLALLAGGWIVVVASLNIGFTWWTRRSLARIHGRVPTPAASPEAPPSGMPRALLDPVAAEIYHSLSRLLHERQRRDVTVADRLHHTDRLASLGQLAAGLAHEIKNPLAGVRGVIELMRDDAGEAQKRDLYTQIVSELDRVNGTIHSLLHFARPSPPDRQETDVATLLESSLQLLRPSLAKRSIALGVEVAHDVGTFALDSAQIRQVVTNLVANAAEAIQETGSIQVRASSFPDGGGLIISVEDDGPGVSEDVRSKIFDPFFTTKFSGTGLGLAVVRSLVSQHGGRVEFQSEVGRGSTFFVLLPRPAKRPGGNEPDAAMES